MGSFFRKWGKGSRHWRAIVLIMLMLLLVGASFRIGIEKDLVGTFSTQGWGRHLFGIGAALTQSRFGITGYVVDDPIEQKLQSEGLTDNPRVLQALGTKFPDNLRDKRLMQAALERARDFPVPAPPPGDYRRLRGSVGDDVGIATYTSLSFRLFGLRVPALYYAYFTLLSLTIVLFICAYWGNPGALACLTLMLLALFLLVASNLINVERDIAGDPAAVDIKDPRFFGTVAAVPVLHLLLAWTLEDDKLSLLDFVLIAGQALIFAFVLHMRWPLLWLLLALCFYWLVRAAWRGKWFSRRAREPSRWPARSLLGGAVFFLVIIGTITALNSAAHPVYRLDGDVLHHPFWHHMVAALEAHPDWDRKYLATVNGVKGDSMPGEIARQEIAKLPIDQRTRYQMRIGYPSPEAIALFARQRFFEILRIDPSLVAETLLVDNPKRMIRAIADFYTELADTMSASSIAFAIIVLAAIAGVAVGDPGAPSLLSRIALAAFVFSLLALAPTVIASPVHQMIMVDFFVWSLFLLGLLTCVGVAYRLRGQCTIRGRARHSYVHSPSSENRETHSRGQIRRGSNRSSKNSHFDE